MKNVTVDNIKSEKMEDRLTLIGDITNRGERVTHLYPNTSYKAHLSIYDFALRFCSGKRVLDAGSGSGYGANFLAEKGAAFVEGIDFSETAVEFSRQYFQRENLRYQRMDIQSINGFADDTFDLIFTSNVLEHIECVSAFLHTAHRLLNPDGVLLVAVPPITNAEARQANLDNIYHLNIWSPRQWHYVLSQYFDEITPYRHHIEMPDYQLNLNDTVETSRPTIADFQFLPISLDTLSQVGALTAIFEAKNKRPNQDLPPAIFSHQMIDDSFTRLIQQQSSRSLTLKGRFAKAFRLAKSNQWSALKQEIRTYIKWQLHILS